MLKAIRNYFITGLIVLLPIFATFYFVIWIFVTVDRIIRPIVPYRIPGLGLVIGLLLIILAGVIGKNVIGRQLIGTGEWLMNRIPLVRQVYTTLKQIMDAFLNQSTMKAFQTVVLVEYPRKGIYQLGFLTNQGMKILQQAAGAELVNIFLPTTPNPTSGMLVMVPHEDVIFPEITVEDGIKLILSGGVLYPNPKETATQGEKEPKKQGV